MFGFTMCGFTVCIWGESDPGYLLGEASQRVMDSVQKLPKYVCTQTVERFRYEPDAAQQGVGKSRPHSCGDILAQVHGAAWKQRLSSSDRIRLDVAVSHDQSGVDGEMYSWVGADRFSGRDLFDMLPAGATSTGTFSSMLASIFGGAAAHSSYTGDRTLAGRTLSEFRFHVPEEESRYSYVFGPERNQRVKIGYEGTFLVDPKTSDIVRVAVRTDPLPAESGACEITRTFDYERMRLHESDFLLPTEARVSIIHADETVAENVITYSACREFHGESTVRFGPSPEAGPPESGKRPPVQKLALPPGLRFKLAFTDGIDPAIAAAGDPIRGKLTTAIRDRSKILVSQGTPVNGRIVSIRRFFRSSKSGDAGREGTTQQPSLVMAIKLESLEIDGTSQPVKAAFDGIQRFAKPAGAPSVRVELGSLDQLQDSGAGVFEFWDEDRAMESGLESNWRTVAPELRD